VKYYILIVFAVFLFIPAYGIENTISDSNVQVTLNYPDVVTPQDEFVFSTIVKHDCRSGVKYYSYSNIPTA
jgi:hypothetical protein